MCWCSALPSGAPVDRTFERTFERAVERTVEHKRTDKQRSRRTYQAAPRTCSLQAPQKPDLVPQNKVRMRVHTHTYTHSHIHTRGGRDCSGRACRVAASAGWRLSVVRHAGPAAGLFAP
eukprot:355105-Chlamydomonas_euryale.AAC.1